MGSVPFQSVKLFEGSFSLGRTIGAMSAIKKIVALVFCLVASFQAAQADLTTVNFDSGNNGNPAVFDQSNNALFGGTIADGNGDVLQLGYYSNATIANPFAGTFTALSGEGSLNTAIIPSSPSSEHYNQTSIGDIHTFGVAQNGTFAIGLDFVAGSSTSGNSLPAAGTPLSIRFFNGTTIAASSFFNAAADPTNAQWLWQSPAAPPFNSVLNMSLGNLGVEWESIVVDLQGSNTAFHTTIPTAVPEVSTVACALLCACGLGLHAFRRHRAKTA
jgi:hypothetical protein